MADPAYDLRYLPAYAPNVELVVDLLAAYGRAPAVERVMAWHVLTALGDALWRTGAGLALPGGGTPATYVDGIARRLGLLGVRA